MGAIYTLERISQESEREYWPIMETLTAYVREHAPWPPRLGNPFVQLQVRTADEMAGESTPAERPKERADGLRNLLIVRGFVPRDETEQTRAQIRPSTDIQAVLDVLGRLGRRLDN